MKTPDDSLPSPLRQAIESRRLVVLCGAGLSVAPPSCLPDWMGFNEAVLHEARRAVQMAYPALPQSCRDTLDSLTLRGLPVQAFSDLVVRTFAGDAWFSILRLLDSDRVNAGHLALADLAGAGTVAAIVTTNFDTLIERAFRERGVPLDVFSERADYDRAQQGACALYKVHGTTSLSYSLVDTVTQKLRGLSLPVRLRLRAIVRVCHLLVIGFSGADLAFSDDYLGVGDALGESLGVTWIMRPGRSPGLEAKAFVARAGSNGTFVEADLSAFLGRMGVQITAPGDDAVVDSLQSTADATARQRLQEWAAGIPSGPPLFGLYLMRLLRHVGYPDAARALRTAVEKGVLRSGDDADRDGVVRTGVAADLLADGAPDDAEAWLSAVLAANGYPPLRPGTERPVGRALAVLASAQRARGEVAAAVQTLVAAVDAAVLGGDPELAGELELALAHARIATHADPDPVLNLLLDARAHAEFAGAADLRIRALLGLARHHIHAAELNLAREALQQAGHLSALVGEIATRTERQELERLVRSPGRVRWCSGRDDQERVLRRQVLALEAQGKPADAAQVLLALFHHLYDGGRARRCLDAARASVAAAIRCGDGVLIADGRRHLAIAHEVVGDVDRAVEAGRQALEDEDALPPPLAAAIRANLAQALSLRGDWDESFALWSDCISNALQRGDQYEAQRVLHTRGKAALRLGRAAEAVADARKLLALIDADDPPSPDRRTDAQGLLRQAEALAQGDIENFTNGLEPGLVLETIEAFERLRPSSEQLDRMERDATTAVDLGNLSLVFLRLEQPARARRTSERALRLYEAAGNELGISRCLNNQATIALEQDDIEGAKELTQRAMALRIALGSWDGQLIGLVQLARIAALEEDFEQAVTLAERCLQLARGRPRKSLAAEAAFVLVTSLQAQGKHYEAMAAVRRLTIELQGVTGPRVAELRREAEAALGGGEIEARPPTVVGATEDAVRRAQQLALRREPQSVRELVDDFTRKHDVSDVDRARLTATYANALKNAGRPAEAVTVFEEAVAAFEREGAGHWAASARMNMLSALRSAQRVDEAERGLRGVLSGDLDGDELQARDILAGVLIQRAAGLEGDARAEYLREADFLLDSVLERRTELEARGHAHFKRAQVASLRDDEAAAGSALDAAIDAFRRCNSVQLDMVEEARRSLDEA